MPLSNHIFNIYSVASFLVPVYIVVDALAQHKTAFNTLVNLTSFKLNLLIFFNGIMMMLVQFSNLLIWIFFGDIRIIEQKVRPFSHSHNLFDFSTWWRNLKRRSSSFCCCRSFWGTLSTSTRCLGLRSYSSFASSIGWSTRGRTTWSPGAQGTAKNTSGLCS